MQSKLLEVLRAEVEDAQVRERQQRAVQGNWNAFTDSLEESLGELSVNTTALTRELLGALVRLQSFTRDSATAVGEQVAALEGDIRSVREQLSEVRLDIDIFGATELSAVENIADATRERLFAVLGP